MTKRTTARFLICFSILMAVIGAIFYVISRPSFAQDRGHLSQQDAPFKSYTLSVHCGSPEFPTAGFYYEVPAKAMGNKNLCAGKCGGADVSLADALSGVPGGVAAAFRAKVTEHQRSAAAGIGKPLPCLRDSKQPPTKKPCENPPSEGKPPPPWSDSCEEETESVSPWVGTQKVDDNGRPLPPGQVWCTATYLFCAKTATSYQAGSYPYGIEVLKKVTIDVASWNNNFNEAAQDACQSFSDDHMNAPATSICCEKWVQAIRNHAPSCDPLVDADCDGITNNQDPFPLHPRSTEYTSYSPVTKFPFWNDFKNAVPQQSCDCQWELIDARYKCANVSVQNSGRRGRSNQAKYDYQAKWKCPATGREIVTNRQVTMPGLYCPRGANN